MSKVCGETVAVFANGDNATHWKTKCEMVKIARIDLMFDGFVETEQPFSKIYMCLINIFGMYVCAKIVLLQLVWR